MDIKLFNSDRTIHIFIYEYIHIFIQIYEIVFGVTTNDEISDILCKWIRFILIIIDLMNAF